MESLLTLGEYKEVYFRLDFEWLKKFLCVVAEANIVWFGKEITIKIAYTSNTSKSHGINKA